MTQETIAQETNDVEPPQINLCKIKIDLRGPYSPLEIPIHNCTRDKTARSISIDGSSVNSILLDSDPQDAHER